MKPSAKHNTHPTSQKVIEIEEPTNPEPPEKVSTKSTTVALRAKKAQRDKSNSPVQQIKFEMSYHKHKTYGLRNFYSKYRRKKSPLSLSRGTSTDRHRSK